MTNLEVAQKVVGLWIEMIQESISAAREAVPQTTTIPTQETIDEFREDVMSMLLNKQPYSLFSYSFVGLRGFEELTCYLPWQAQTSTLIDWKTGEVTVR